MFRLRKSISARVASVLALLLQMAFIAFHHHEPTDAAHAHSGGVDAVEVLHTAIPEADQELPGQPDHNHSGDNHDCAFCLFKTAVSGHAVATGPSIQPPFNLQRQLHFYELERRRDDRLPSRHRARGPPLATSLT
jgi:Protein of unknown function (DUF2946)